jgi:hypothetical protein
MIAVAPDATAGQWYAGTGYGRSSISIGAVNEPRSIALPHYFHSDPIVTSVDDDDKGYKVFTAIRFNRALASNWDTPILAMSLSSTIFNRNSG